MTASEGSAWDSKYLADIKEHGPLPTYINVRRSGNTSQYTIRVSNQNKIFWHHPLSPSGREEWGPMLAGAGEEKGSKAEFPGVAHPPIVYKPSEWLWKSDGKIMVVLASAFRISNLNITPNDLEAQGNGGAIDRLMSTHHQLYHPRDREKLAVFENEHRLSCWARYFKRGLVVVSPELNKDRQNWAAYKNHDAKNRPAIRARYSTGYQEEFPPIILGCLPTSETSARWFYLVPVEATKGRFDNLWKRCIWADQAAKFHYANNGFFIWVAVSLQRSIALGASPIPDQFLGDVIVQYGQYLTANNGHGKNIFRYNQAKHNTSSPKVTFHELTRWVMASEENSSARCHAKAWNNAIALYVAHRKSLTLTDWEKFLSAAAAVQIKK